MDRPTNPAPAPAQVTQPPGSPDPSPLPLWTMLEKEFLDLHGSALGLDSAYDVIREENLAAARRAVEAQVKILAWSTTIRNSLQRQLK